MKFARQDNQIGYERACSNMEAHVAAIRDGRDSEQVWLVEHPPIYTAGTSAREEDLLDARFPVFKTGRGGEYTYHGPGQRVAYVMMDLLEREGTPDLKKYVCRLEEWVMRSLAVFDIVAERREGRVGLWVDMARYGYPAGTEHKIAAIGVRVRRWVTYHGVAVNIDPDLSHFSGIVPCGIREHGVTSIKALTGCDIPLKEFDAVLMNQWAGVFGDEPEALFDVNETVSSACNA